jgi:hypothetical protein
MSERRQFGVNQFVFVSWSNSCWVKRNSSWVTRLYHVWTELHWLLHGLWSRAIVCAYLSNCVQMIIQVIGIPSNSVHWCRIVRVIGIPWTSCLSMWSDYLQRLVVGINRSWLSSTLLKCLSLILESLSMLLIGLD